MHFEQHFKHCFLFRDQLEMSSTTYANAAFCRATQPSVRMRTGMAFKEDSGPTGDFLSFLA